MVNKTTNSNKSKKKVLKKPNVIIYNFLAVLGWVFTKIKLNTHYSKTGFKDMKGPAIVLASHMSNIDFLLVAVQLMPNRPTYIVSQHFMSKPLIRWFLNLNHVIPKKMFCADINAMRQILRAKDSGNVIVIFPEGRLSCTGHTLSITDGTAELVKKLGIDVYWIKELGAYKSWPKWGKTGMRRGRIEVEGGKLFSPDELKSLSVDEIQEGIEKAILHDDDLVLQDVSYQSKAPAKGLDGILYKCPMCGEEFKNRTTDSEIICDSCGFSAVLNNNYELAYKDAENGEKAPFKLINQWYSWQSDRLDVNESLEMECFIGTPDEEGNMDRNAGEGFCWINREEIGVKGTLRGEAFEFSEKIMNIKGLPATVGDHFDLYHKGIMYYIIPKGDRREVIKWVQFMDKAVTENLIVNENLAVNENLVVNENFAVNENLAVKEKLNLKEGTK